VELLVLEERHQADPQRVASADLAKLRRYLPVIKRGIITAYAADDLEQAGAVVLMIDAATGGPAPQPDKRVWLVFVINH
jgi:hypothetical protein